MNTNQVLQYAAKNWLKITFTISGSIFLLSIVSWSDRILINLWNAYLSPYELVLVNDYRTYIVTIIQYLAVAVLVMIAIKSFLHKPSLWSAIFLLVYGFLTFFFIIFASIFRYYCCGLIPTTGGASDHIATLTVYVSTISGFMAAITGLYTQIIAGRKAMAEIQLEKIRLQVEQEKAKAKGGKRKTTKSRK